MVSHDPPHEAGSQHSTLLGVLSCSYAYILLGINNQIRHGSTYGEERVFNIITPKAALHKYTHEKQKITRRAELCHCVCTKASRS